MAYFTQYSIPYHVKFRCGNTGVGMLPYLGKKSLFGFLFKDGSFSILASGRHIVFSKYYKSKIAIKMDRGNADCRVYVGNLPTDVKAKDLDDLFYKYGTIKDISLKKDTRGGQPFAFIEFEDPRYLLVGRRLKIILF
jgi:hypothetical protein